VRERKIERAATASGILPGQHRWMAAPGAVSKEIEQHAAVARNAVATMVLTVGVRAATAALAVIGAVEVFREEEVVVFAAAAAVVADE
jgi:hypothetical protein